MLAAIFLSGMILGAGSIAFAAIAHSAWGYYGPYLGYNYRNQADIALTGYYANAGTAVEENPWDEGVPTGYMAAQAYLYLNDIIVKSTMMRYSDSVCYRWYVMTEDYFGQGTYYSKGKTAAYNGNGYNYYYMFQSPSQSTN